jgi:F420H(2)-dependent quinone reductase
MRRTQRDPAERSHILRLFYRDWRPTRLGKLNTALWAWLAAHGLTSRQLVTLQVKGRRSGRLRATVLVVAWHDGNRFLVSMLGDDAEWVRNVRAAGGEAFVERVGSRPVRLTEIAPAERAPILKAYCEAATSGRRHLPVPPDAPLSEFAAVADRYPVFRIGPASAPAIPGPHGSSRVD